MADGGCKAAEEIAIGDEILTLSVTGSPSRQSVRWVDRAIQPLLKVVHERGEFTSSVSHEVLLHNGTPICVSELEPEHDLLGDDRLPVRVIATVRCGSGLVCAWTCEPEHTFVASGIVHHNKVALGG